MMRLRRIFLLAMMALLTACSEQPKNTGMLNESKNTAGTHINGRDAVVIGPAHATVQSIMSLKTSNAAISGGEIHWYVNGEKAASSKGLLLTLDSLKKGDIVQAVLVNGDNTFPSNEITIKNTPPAVHKAVLLPSRPVVSDILKPDIKVVDADGDNITFKYHWNINGTFAGEDSYLQAVLKRDDRIIVEVTPFDGEEPGRSIRLETVIYNSLPAVTESKPSFDGKTYRYHIAAADPDNDSLTFKLQHGPKGMTVDPSSGIITWEVRPEDKGRHEIQVSVSDNNGGEIIVPLTAKISVEEIK